MLASACIINDMTVHAIEVALLGPQHLLVEGILWARARAISRQCRGAAAVLQSGALRRSVPEHVPRHPLGPDLSLLMPALAQRVLLPPP